LYIVKNNICFEYEITKKISIFKIGKTTDISKRIYYYNNDCYSQNTQVHALLYCYCNLALIEGELIDALKKNNKFKHIDKLGNEYFSGNITDVVIIMSIIIQSNGGGNITHSMGNKVRVIRDSTRKSNEKVINMVKNRKMDEFKSIRKIFKYIKDDEKYKFSQMKYTNCLKKSN
jgi:UDP-N-acetylglucosamine 2-epimerase